MLCEEKKHAEYRHGFEMIYYSPKMIKAVCRDILKAKEEKTKRYRDYDAIVQKMKESSQSQTSGFWKNAILVE